MEEELSRFRRRTKASAALYEEARSLTPFGVHSNYRFVDPYPLYFARGKGSRIWDVDNNEYVDYQMAFGALVAGHAHVALVKAMDERIRDGTIFGFEGEDGPKLAKLICRRFSLDMVKFSSTGLEATMHAVRLARSFTSRKKILKFEGCYHGSHDTLLVSVKPSNEKAGDPRFPNAVPASLGMLDEIVESTLVAPFNDADSVEKLVGRHKQEIACMILEPIPMNMGFVPPKPGFLDALRRLCDENGIVLIFDEVKTCGKFYGGATGHFKVEPDLATLGKAIAGGYPLSLVGGKKEIMETIVPGKVSHAGTFNSNPLSVAAGIVTLTKVLTESAMSKAQALGEQLGKGYTDIIRNSRISARAQWMGLSGTIHFTTGEVANWRDFLKCNVGRWWRYYTMMVNRGVLPMATGPDEQWTVSVQHTKEDLEKHLESFKEVASELHTDEPSMAMVEAV
jgi:glutamate-1-semialdehyde 2,1-aminomutase